MPTDFSRNNIDRAASPYLLQHKDNPVWWQEWNTETLAHARSHNKIIFASIGYASCHWCHVMAAEAFNDARAAAYLNEHFVSVKIDREQRPDIDQYAMAFIFNIGNRGGWPLNIFFTPALRPIYAITYAPVEARYGMTPFADVLREIKTFYDENGGMVEEFTPSRGESPGIEEGDIVRVLTENFDEAYGGFGIQAKFPPHSTVLFMLYYYEVNRSAPVKEMIVKTLDAMRLKGLHDHLQGGFFRYAVDRAWAIPHFEKMLYDQALLLWEYSLAYRLFGDEAYASVARKIIRCLDDTFEHGGVYYSGHDADTDHREGASYLWTKEELEDILTPEEMSRFRDVYEIADKGNFESKYHLAKRRDDGLEAIEERLLEARKARPQPSVDRKVVTSWNCLAGIGLVQAYRHMGDAGALERAETLFRNLKMRNVSGGRAYHSSFDGRLQNEEFLQDYAAMLLFLIYLDDGTGAYADEIALYREVMLDYRKDGRWMESKNPDFLAVPAESVDNPIPSSVSLAEFVLTKLDPKSACERAATGFAPPLERDFFNISALTCDVRAVT